ncbi:MAG: hypothetical protein Q8T08_09820 [Ignavibacteria bacterium]|nr:hypothetical protein [Ignavibacteria bacterium]
MKKKCTNCGHNIGLFDMVISPKINYHICSECGERQKTSYYTVLIFMILVVLNFIFLNEIYEIIGFIVLYILFWPVLNLMFGFRK